MKRLTDRFEAAISACGSLAALQGELDQACKDLGFSYFALLHHANIAGARPSLLRLHNYPSTWVELLEADAGGIVDPVHSACRHKVAGFSWFHLEQRPAVGSMAISRLTASRDHGLGDGFTIPVHIPGEPSGSCSFVTAVGEPLPQACLQSAELIGRMAFEAARALTRRDEPIMRPHLSPRERSCLQLVACGKTDWEVAVILGISTETARQYLKRARNAYDVTSRTQLVVLSLRDDWLSFDDVVPPPR